jgi:hypothetical protein
MVVQGHASTLSVSLDDVSITRAASPRRATRALVVADLPFGSYQAGVEAAYAASADALKAGASMVKLEGGAWLAPTVEFLGRSRDPVCGHVGPAAASGQHARRLSRAGQDARRGGIAASPTAAHWAARGHRCSSSSAFLAISARRSRAWSGSRRSASAPDPRARAKCW